jgi:hypothetical protein
MRHFIHAFLAALVIAWASSNGDGQAQPVPLEHDCSVPAGVQWTAQERFVWARICVGDVADMNGMSGAGASFDPFKDDNSRDGSRILRSSFLETILLNDRYRRALTRLGVEIIGAHFVESLDLANGELAHALLFSNCLFDKGVNFTRLKSARLIGFFHSRIKGQFRMETAELGSALYIREGAELDGLALAHTRISESLDLDGAKVIGALSMNDVQIGGSVFMRRGAFNDTSLRGSRVARDIDLSEAHVLSRLDMTDVQIGGSAFMRNGVFENLSLRRARIVRGVDLEAAKLGGPLDMDEGEIAGNIFMRSASFLSVKVRRAHVGNMVDLTRSKFSGALDVAETQIDGILLIRESDLSKEALM